MQWISPLSASSRGDREKGREQCFPSTCRFLPCSSLLFCFGQVTLAACEELSTCAPETLADFPILKQPMLHSPHLCLAAFALLGNSERSTENYIPLCRFCDLPSKFCLWRYSVSGLNLEVLENLLWGLGKINQKPSSVPK